MKKLDLALAWIVVVLGFVHCGSTIAGYHGLSADRIWFFVGGIALVECGFLNLVRCGGGRGMARVSSTISNVLLFLALIGLCVVALANGHLLRSTMLLASLAVVGAETLFSIAS